MYKIEILKKKKGSKYYWRIKARNGKILAHSETYNSKQAARKTAVNVSYKLWKIEESE